MIGDISFGKAFGFLAEDRDLYRYLEINNAAVPVMNLLQTVPWLTNVLYRWPLRLALPNDGDQVGFGRLMGCVGLFLLVFAIRRGADHLCDLQPRQGMR